MVRAEEINMENQEDVLDALCCYEKKPTPDIPPVLDQYLRRVAKTGETLFPWQQLKILFIHKLDSVITQFNQDFPADHLQNCPNVENVKFEEMKKRVVCSLEEFQGAPFTIQRLCELVTEPKKHYKRTDKFLRGIEKNVLVVSTVDPFGRKIVSDSRPMMNGLDMNGYNGNRPENKPHFSTFPTPSSQQTTWPSERVFSPELSKELSNPLYDSDASPSPNFPASDGEKIQPAPAQTEQQAVPKIKSQENVAPMESVGPTDPGNVSLPSEATPTTGSTDSSTGTTATNSEVSDTVVTPQQSSTEPEKDVQPSSDAEQSTENVEVDTAPESESSKPNEPQGQEEEEGEDLSVSSDAQDSDQISSSSSLSSSSSPEPVKELEESASKESEISVTTNDDRVSEDSESSSSLPVSQDATVTDTADSSVESSSSSDCPHPTSSEETTPSSTVQSDSTTDSMETESSVPTSDSVADNTDNVESTTNNETDTSCVEEMKIETENSSDVCESVATPMEQD